MSIENTFENMLENCKYIDVIIGILTLNQKNTQTKSFLNYFMDKWHKNSSRRHIVTKNSSVRLLQPHRVSQSIEFIF